MGPSPQALSPSPTPHPPTPSPHPCSYPTQGQPTTRTPEIPVQTAGLHVLPAHPPQLGGQFLLQLHLPGAADLSLNPCPIPWPWAGQLSGPSSEPWDHRRCRQGWGTGEPLPLSAESQGVWGKSCLPHRDLGQSLHVSEPHVLMSKCPDLGTGDLDIYFKALL